MNTIKRTYSFYNKVKPRKIIPNPKPPKSEYENHNDSAIIFGFLFITTISIFLISIIYEIIKIYL